MPVTLSFIETETRKEMRQVLMSGIGLQLADPEAKHFCIERAL